MYSGDTIKQRYKTNWYDGVDMRMLPIRIWHSTLLFRSIITTSYEPRVFIIIIIIIII